MACRERGDLEAVHFILKEAGYSVSKPCVSRPSCFDFAARKKKSVLFLRIHPEVSGFSGTDSEELMTISKTFAGASLIIGDKSRQKPLADDTVYTRHDIHAVTLKTFERTLRDLPPLVQAAPGGYYVQIDREALCKRRKELGLSVGDIASRTGISRRTVYGYERGLAKASIHAAYRLMWTLGIPVLRPVKLLEPVVPGYTRRAIWAERRITVVRTLLERILRIFKNSRVAAVKKAPFDFMIALPKENIRVLGTLAASTETRLVQRIGEISSLSKITGAWPLLITRDHDVIETNLPCITCAEVSTIRSPEDLISSLT